MEGTANSLRMSTPNDTTKQPDAHDKANDSAKPGGPDIEPALPGHPVYGHAENFGSPGGDEAPPGTDPKRGSPTDAQERG